ncbi:proteasome-type protease [Thioalbus denitrificans]|uniref:Putative proteasome-type protease n=1 Tax=Thioalbus denitrificans TaxID=547122 RepID=A0A369C8N0_9GAMM|nr:proteasome-type protease [Thioalbus denitrificans]RCX30249.1 putative proteasome-type protease [Thioalbus denitrificans]
MTYCVALILDQGMVFASDSRTNAGVDYVSSFSKMKVFERPGDRVIVILSSGNLAITQGVMELLERRIHDQSPNLMEVESLYDAALLVGGALREMQGRDGQVLAQYNIDYGASFLVGGQIAGEAPRLFNVYSQGNFIEATLDTPYFQIGESKYGKPILDRVITRETPLDDAVKCVLISFDSTIRSNISVGPPIDLLCYRHNAVRVDRRLRIAEDDPYFQTLRRLWSEGLRGVFATLPAPP